MEIENKEFQKYVNQIDEINYICIVLKSFCEKNIDTEKEKATKIVVNWLFKKTEKLLAEILDKYSEYIKDLNN